MLLASEFIGHKDAEHPQSYSEKRYDRYFVMFEIGGEYFSGELR